MARNGTYYLGRVLKLGSLTQSTLLQALASPLPIESRGGNWALIDIRSDDADRYVYGRLARYLPEGRVDVVNPSTLSTDSQLEPNLLVYSVPFVYIPAHSGIAFLANSGKIDQHTFVKRFCQIIERSLDNFFVDCEIQLIADLRAFATRVAALDAIYKIQARVSPPNPLFGPLWEKLKDYLISRNADRLNLIEDAAFGETLNSDLPSLAAQFNDSFEYPSKEILDEIPIGDAAILMAVDGYGAGTIRGRSHAKTVVIRTSETVANFEFEKDPPHHELFEAANEQFETIKRDRYMGHA